MQLEIITPESLIFKGEATAVQFPGLDGSFQVLNNHAPIISGLSAGTIKVDLVDAIKVTSKTNPAITAESNGKIIHVAIKGGVVEMQNNKIIVLAE
ncbi:FoF1 ATP synthase subunit delta/epsilon [Fluviicola taffensis]|uniref:ATPase, F1 complex, delta/epsilon subunit n=1 Tax=Fluviicola taffensis (strain DSM 16823 / NCIMB 13979 / RW262) TaxID=755732 RepID=F2IAH6_FLUTR|nr:F0F1 ATP synthase subunit epsilon [Fluviicola taffensis]AEA43112.1 ATPase, F1 complex, delta/epsilon subunit [Fluviicola taffensis DSM 16823]